MCLGIRTKLAKILFHFLSLKPYLELLNKLNYIHKKVPWLHNNEYNGGRNVKANETLQNENLSMTMQQKQQDSPNLSEKYCSSALPHFHSF